MFLSCRFKVYERSEVRCGIEVAEVERFFVDFELTFPSCALKDSFASHLAAKCLWRNREDENDTIVNDTRSEAMKIRTNIQTFTLFFAVCCGEKVKLCEFECRRNTPSTCFVENLLICTYVFCV